jgi:polyvinyl alcohol dehydrogenase (cytochrome)
MTRGLVLVLSGLAAVLGAGWVLTASRPVRADEPAKPPWFGGIAVDLTAGARLYGERCASCHDKPAERIPSKDTISRDTPTFIFGVLHDGVMSAVAKGLSSPEIASIARYLSRDQTGDTVDHASAEVPACSDAPGPLRSRDDDWNGWGRDVANSRFQPRPGMTVADVRRLKLKWAIGMAGDRDGQATLVGGRLFTNNSAGTVYALDAKTGCAYWRFNAAAGTRTTITLGALPTSVGTANYGVYFADRQRDVYALDANSGALLWKTHVDDQPATTMTGSPTFYQGRLFVPVSSAEEYFAKFDNYPCCRFRGAVVALDGASGKILWKTYTTQQPAIPFAKNANGAPLFGPAGGAVWSAPTIDARRRLLYVGTGNSYTEAPHEGSDAVIAMALDSGAIQWISQLGPKDNYIIGCRPGIPRGVNCPGEVGGDYDIGSSPILHVLNDGRRILLVGQKSSQIWGLDPDNGGAVLWSVRLSQGGPLGGVEFGPATDADNIYAAISDIYMGAGARPGLTAIRASDGQIVWSTPGTRLPCRWRNEYSGPAQSQAVTAIPGVIFSGSMDGHLRAYAASTGAVIWDFATGDAPFMTLSGRTAQGGVLDAAGPTVADGMLYVHSGYAGRSGPGGTVLLAFSVDGR